MAKRKSRPASRKRASAPSRKKSAVRSRKPVVVGLAVALPRGRSLESVKVMLEAAKPTAAKHAATAGPAPLKPGAKPGGGAPPTTAERLEKLARRAQTDRVVVMEGDSWFHFPLLGADGLDNALRKEHGYKIAHYARAGATLLQMVHGGRRDDLETVVSALCKVKPRVMLFSGGGNDVVGWEFTGYLNHKNSGRPIINEAFTAAQFDTKFLPAYRTMIDRVLDASPETKIFVHGYAHAFPSGNRVKIPILDDLGIIRIGPWLKPALDANGWSFDEGREAIRHLIDRLNEMLLALQNNPMYLGKFFHVDLRPLVTEPGDWRDELHLHNRPWRRCADKINEVVFNALDHNW